MTEFKVDDRVRISTVYAAGNEDDKSMLDIVGREGTVVEVPDNGTNLYRVKLETPIIYAAGELFYPEELVLV